jgi:hypothetical protein
VHAWRRDICGRSPDDRGFGVPGDDGRGRDARVRSGLLAEDAR